MAELFLSAVIEAIVGSLTSLVGDKLQPLGRVDGEIQRLSDTMGRIRALLSDAEERQVTSEALNLWRRQLKVVAYSVEDIIEEYALDLSSSKAVDQENIMVRISSHLPFKKPKFQHDIGVRIKEIREKMDEIVDEGYKLQLPGVAPQGKIGTVVRPTYSYVVESKIYGRENDKRKIIEMLLASGSGGVNLTVIPILGMGGLGKTTLAQLVYNDEEVTKHFHIRIWVCVSDDFDVNWLFKTIIESITKSSCGLTEMDQLQSRLRELLDGKRYLLVLDDVWNEAFGKWERFEKPLRCGDKGSKIVVTTRSRKVATITGETNSYPLGMLQDADCWSLFAERAFGGREDTYPNLIKIGKEIVKKCKGVPLAAKTLGALLSFKREASDLSFWIFVRKNELWKLEEEDPDGIFPALRLSYNHLPAHLKRCFAYCSIFPKDYKINKETLIQQWIAVDFVPLSMGGQLAEDIGNGYFNDLLWRSFFQDVSKDELGEIKYCKMHDLIHDLAASVAKDECLIWGSGMEKSSLKGILYASCSWQYGHAFSEHVHEAKNLRALLGIYGNFDKLFSKRLRVLRSRGSIARFVNYRHIPDSIGKLLHLRFLDLSSTGNDRLPKSITSLQKLQTLIPPANIRRLPDGISNMVSLRHLDISNCFYLTCMPSRIGQLTSLQTLPRFIVGKESGCGIEELEKLQLRGDIRIDELENVGDVDNATRSKLKEKLLLRSVGFYWSEHKSYDGEANRLDNVEEVLEALQPPENLKRLWLINYNGSSFPKWLMNSLLPYLVDIVLYNCEGCEFLPPLGQLPNLRTLILDRMDSVKCLDDKFYGNGTVKGFPSLKRLVLRNMPNLVGWSGIDGIDLFPCLKILIVHNCGSFTSLPEWLGNLTSLRKFKITRSPHLKCLPTGPQKFSSLQNLEIMGCHDLFNRYNQYSGTDWHSIKHIPFVQIDPWPYPRIEGRMIGTRASSRLFFDHGYL